MAYTDEDVINYAQRIAALEAEKDGLTEDIGDVYKEVKQAGIEPKILRQALKDVRRSKAEIMEERDSVDTMVELIVGKV